MDSIFLKATQRPFNVTFFMVEHFTKAVKEGGKEVQMGEAVGAALEACGIQSTDENKEYLAARIVEENEKWKGSNKGSSSSRGKKQFGDGFAQWGGGLSPQELCMYLSEYDFEKARYLYCSVDKQDVMSLANGKLKYDMELAVLSYEACLFGFGGWYGDDDKNVMVNNVDQNGDPLADTSIWDSIEQAMGGRA